MTETETIGTTTSAVSPFTFQSTTFEVVDLNGQPWLRSPQIGDALGYAKAGRISIDKLYKSNADEFTENMTSIVKLETGGGIQDVRIFSLRGAHLLGMLARTKIAKQFRVWVLDLIEKHGQPQPVASLAPYSAHNQSTRPSAGFFVSASIAL